ncbi:MAG: DUF3999 family protein [Bacteroidales bacterium]|nr:DUF3999 family protein [Bacteroidales bacterium]
MKVKLTYLLLFICSFSFGQINKYDYKRELLEIKDQWHKVVLPNEIFGKVLPDFSDIRIYGITKKNDTIEAPYIFRFAAEKISQKDVPFNLINQSKNDNGYYFTFEIPTKDPINQLKLDFGQQDFDWRLVLEGSQNQQEWFTIVENYRILSIRNELTDFQFTKIAFPNSKYRYFRLHINSSVKPDLIAAKISLIDFIDGDFRSYNFSSIKTENDKQNKQTIINLNLKPAVPVCYLKIFVKDTFDYYRPVTIKYLTDSVNTQQGWKYSYSTLTSGTLNSIEGNVFLFSSTILKKLKVVIENHDNKPLQIDSLVVKGYVYELLGRFTEPAIYYLTYGNNQASKPQYDIDRFADKIPTTLKTLKLGDEQLNGKKVKSKTEPLFQNKIWLWSIMALIIILLGWFSIRMIKKK